MPAGPNPLSSTPRTYKNNGITVIGPANNIINNTIIDGTCITGRELKDLNRARAYTADVAARYADFFFFFPFVSLRFFFFFFSFEDVLTFLFEKIIFHLSQHSFQLWCHTV